MALVKSDDSNESFAHYQVIADKGCIGEQYIIIPKNERHDGEFTAEDKDLIGPFLTQKHRLKTSINVLKIMLF